MTECFNIKFNIHSPNRLYWQAALPLLCTNDEKIELFTGKERNSLEN